SLGGRTAGARRGGPTLPAGIAGEHGSGAGGQGHSGEAANDADRPGGKLGARHRLLIPMNLGELSRRTPQICSQTSFYQSVAPSPVAESLPDPVSVLDGMSMGASPVLPLSGVPAAG